MEVIGVGVDLVDIDRVERMLERHGARMLRKLLTEAEREYVSSMHRPATHIAARIAAKEATYKAFQALPGASSVSWQHLEVKRRADGWPAVILSGPAAELAERHGPLHVQLSLTHSNLAAAAVALLIRGRITA